MNSIACELFGYLVAAGMLFNITIVTNQQAHITVISCHAEHHVSHALSLTVSKTVVFVLIYK
jgi:hypothetical protein